MTRRATLARTLAFWAASLALAFGLAASPAEARVSLVNERGFIIHLIATVPAEPDKVWAELVNPADWWDKEHSFSGDSANFTLDPKPGGCFCETLPGADAGAPPRGGVEHMRVIYVEKPRAMRLSGALGPMQADALTGTLTMQLKPAEGGGTEILWEYVVGGLSRAPFDAMSTSVDQVLGEQLQRLSEKLGGKPADAAAPGPKSAKAAAGAPKSEIIGR
jgi:hypothetical protein